VAHWSAGDYHEWLRRRIQSTLFCPLRTVAAGVLHGDLGHRSRRTSRCRRLLKRAWPNNAILAFFVFLIMIPVSLTLGVLAGMMWFPLDRVIPCGVFTNRSADATPCLIR